MCNASWDCHLLSAILPKIGVWRHVSCKIKRPKFCLFSQPKAISYLTIAENVGIFLLKQFSQLFERQGLATYICIESGKGAESTYFIMDQDTATRFVSSLVKSIQALCNGYIDFSSSIEVVGHIHLNIDRNVKFDYVLTEEVCKSISEGATVFASHSYHSEPPPSVTANSKTASDALNQNRRKSQVTPNDDPLRIGSLPSEVPKTGKSDNHSRVSSRGDGGDTSHSGGASVSQDSSSFKQENNRKSCQVQESADRRRKSIPSAHRTPSPAAKRSRNYDLNSAAKNTFDVIEIKEEPDDEPTVYFGDNSSHVAAGQDIQTPDFSNVVMESLDRVGQIEGTQLVAGSDGMQQQQSPFPVMLHSTSGMPSSSMPSSSGAVAGPSLDPLATASTSGVLSEAELTLLLRRQRNAMHARMYRQRAKQSEEKHQRLKESAKVRQRRYLDKLRQTKSFTSDSSLVFARDRVQTHSHSHSHNFGSRFDMFGGHVDGISERSGGEGQLQTQHSVGQGPGEFSNIKFHD